MWHAPRNHTHMMAPNGEFTSNLLEITKHVATARLTGTKSTPTIQKFRSHTAVTHEFI